MPPASDLVGKCLKGGYNVCTYRSNFHLFLSNLQLTPMGAKELDYIEAQYHKQRNPLVIASGGRPQVFLYEVSELTSSSSSSSSTTNNASDIDLRHALQSFLGLAIPISPFIWFKPGRDHEGDQEKIKALDAKKIDICQGQYDALRQILQQQATNASRWIRHYLLEAPEVSVSNKASFAEIMRGWETDPCTRRTGRR
jgi:hypothetical protein